MFQKAIGDQNLEYELNKLANNPKIQESIRNMNMVIDSGQRGDYEAGDFYHNIQIGRVMAKIRKRAWASIANDPQVYLLTKKQKKQKLLRYHKKLETRGSIDQILSIPK